MSNLYCVKALLHGNTIWQFNAIVAKSKEEAINNTKWSMKRIMGTISEYQWSAELEWEGNLAVN
jgi:hypothetical protein